MERKRPGPSASHLHARHQRSRGSGVRDVARHQVQGTHEHCPPFGWWLDPLDLNPPDEAGRDVRLSPHEVDAMRATRLLSRNTICLRRPSGCRTIFASSPSMCLSPASDNGTYPKPSSCLAPERRSPIPISVKSKSSICEKAKHLVASRP